jgi:hypothetical protein
MTYQAIISRSMLIVRSGALLAAVVLPLVGRRWLGGPSRSRR